MHTCNRRDYWWPIFALRCEILHSQCHATRYLKWGTGSQDGGAGSGIGLNLTLYCIVYVYAVLSGITLTFYQIFFPHLFPSHHIPRLNPVFPNPVSCTETLYTKSEDLQYRWLPWDSPSPCDIQLPTRWLCLSRGREPIHTTCDLRLDSWSDNGLQCWGSIFSSNQAHFECLLH